MGYSHVPAGQVAPHVVVGPVDIGGQSQETARASIEAFAREAQKAKVTISYEPQNAKGYSWHFAAADLGLSVDVEATLAKAMQAGRDNPMGRIEELVGGAKDTHTVAPVPGVDNAVLEAALKGIAHSLNRPAKPGHVVITESGAFKLSQGKAGISVDIPASSEAVKREWLRQIAQVESVQPAGQDPDNAHSKNQTTQDAESQPESPGAPAAGEVALVIDETKPRIGQEALSRIDGPLGEMNTRIRGTAQRVNNVTIATSHINGTLLGPGDIFSYNQIVGKRSEEGGYEKAIIFVKGRHVEDVGGGICQTASTLYNAVLRSGLKVVRRQPHCTPVVYVPYGLDATVAYGVVDFQFQNDTDSPVYIYAKAVGRSLTFRLYGKTDPNRKVVLTKLRQSSVAHGVTIVENRALKPGRRIVKDKGARGYSIAWRRTVLENGKPVKSEIISSHYKPLSSIVEVGPGAKPAGTAIKPVPAGTKPISPAPNAPAGTVPAPPGA